jgi:hypothetical protein
MHRQAEESQWHRRIALVLLDTVLVSPQPKSKRAGTESRGAWKSFCRLRCHIDSVGSVKSIKAALSIALSISLNR